MQFKKQPKVHTYAKKRRRKTNPARAVLSVGITFLIAGAIGVVGYSIAKPILLYTGDDVSQAQSAPVAENTTPPAEAVTEPTEATPQSLGGNGILLTAADLANRTAFETALASAREKSPDGTVLVMPLKVQGGALLFQTENALAQQCGAVQGTMQLSEMVDVAKAQGWTPVAQCSLLDDNLLPNANAQAGYLVTDGSRWLDNTKQNGGKAWASPFSDITVQYLTDLTEEIVSAGFSQIWCADVIFPPFRQSDLTFIGESVQSPSRSDILLQLLNHMIDAAGTVPVVLQTDAEGIMAGTEEALQANGLNISGVAVDFEAGGTDATAVLQQVSQAVPNQPIWLSGASALSEEMTALQASSAMVSGCVLY